jgi:HD-GYP domain-containing protein (c-di-GMP phosphodiesterase class II)
MSALEALLDRCTNLGLPAWLFDASGNLLRGPAPDGPAGVWADLPGVRAMVTAAATTRLAARSGGEFDAAAVELFPACTLVLLRQGQGRRCAGLVAAVILQRDAIDLPEFAASCRGGDVSLDEARRSAAAAAAEGPREAERLCTALGWMGADLGSLSRESRSVKEFSVQLSEMYEEIGLLYRLGRSMNHLTNPDEFVIITCDELAKTLPFTWIAAKFGNMAQVVPTLAGRLFVAGTLPCPARPLDAQANLVLGTLVHDRWRLVPDGGGPGSQLAALAGGPVLVHPVSRDGLVIGAILAGGKRGPDPEITSFETQLLDAAAGYLSVFAENAGLYADQEALFMGTLQALTAAIDAKDRYTCGHSERVAHVAHELALASGLPPAFAARVRISGLLHDVGKIGVPEAVLTKPGRLTDDEFHLIKLHPTIGHRILKDIPQLQDVLPGVLHHHERWDGGGYPTGLAGEQIPLIARLLAVADAFDAMSSTRSYRAAMPRERVLTEIARSAGNQLDPDLAATFARLDLTEYDRMVKRHRAVLRVAA